MATVKRYGIPNMAALPKKLGREIIKEMLSTPPPDFEKMHKESVEKEKEIKIELEKYLNEKK